MGGLKKGTDWQRFAAVVRGGVEGGGRQNKREGVRIDDERTDVQQGTNEYGVLVGSTRRRTQGRLLELGGLAGTNTYRSDEDVRGAEGDRDKYEVRSTEKYGVQNKRE